MAPNLQIKGGAFQDLEGNVLTNGFLTLQLSHDAQYGSGNAQVVGGVIATVPLDDNGNIPTTPATLVYSNDVLTPSNTSYLVNAFRSDLSQAWRSPQYWTLTSGVNPLDVGTIIPSNPPPPGNSGGGSLLTLQTNSVNNTVQNKLNLIQGTGVTLTADSLGGVTIASSGSSSGSLTLVSNTQLASAVNFGAPTLPVNVSNEGTFDWMVWGGASSTSIQFYSYDPGQYRWKKTKGGLITTKRALIFFAPSDVQSSNITAGPMSWSANAGDDAGGANTGNSTTYPMTNLQGSLFGMFQNVTSAVPTGYGFAHRYPLIAGIQRTFNFYVWQRSQTNKTNTGTFTAHLDDASASDVTTTVTSTSGGSGGVIVVNKISIQVTAAHSCDLISTFILTSTTGVTGTTGDGIGLTGITVS